MRWIMNNLAKLWWGGDPDVKNPMSGMSLRDIYNVQISWAKIYADSSASGFLMFKRLFEADPESKTFFTYIANASEAEMARNLTFRGHIVYIMASLNTAVVNIAYPELVVPILYKLGHAHNRKHVRRRQFLILRDVIVNILQVDLHCSEDVVASWRLFISFMYENIFTIITE